MQINEGRNKTYPSDSLLHWSQWQLLDSLLPTGGFAHSFGLEAAVQCHLVSNPDELKTFIIHVLENTGSLFLPFVYSASVSPNMETWHNLDKILDATLTNEVGRKASTSQGSALMRVASAVFSEIPSLKTMRDATLGSGTVSFHHAPIFGLVCGALGFDTTTSQRAYMFITMRDVISAATRLNLIGPLGAALLQHQVAPIAEVTLEKWMNRGVEEACQTAPLLDTMPGRTHEDIRKLFKLDYFKRKLAETKQHDVSKAAGNPDTTGKNNNLAQGSGSSQLPTVHPNPDMMQYNTNIPRLPPPTGITSEQGSNSSGVYGDFSLLSLNEQMDSNSTDEDSLYGAAKRFLK
ncbi:unnamed protein product [Lupinus luteus]|uniref:Urease accessory protein F n=1 Tax=Lupinus luteus TaxID=3873 RepID=A0AAV1WDR1_LUPLU